MGQTIIDTVVAHRALAAAGQAGVMWGHVAVRDPQGRGVWTKAAGWGLEEVNADRLVLVDFDGEQIYGRGSPHVECFIHTELMKTHGEVCAAVHTHTPAAIAFAGLGVSLEPLSYDSIPFLNSNVVQFDDSSDLITDSVGGAALAAAIGTAAGCLIPGHGMVTAGPDVAVAVMFAVWLDRACKVQLDAMAAGELANHSFLERWNDRQVASWIAGEVPPTFEYLQRRADRLYGAVSFDGPESRADETGLGFW